MSYMFKIESAFSANEGEYAMQQPCPLSHVHILPLFLGLCSSSEYFRVHVRTFELCPPGYCIVSYNIT